VVGSCNIIDYALRSGFLILLFVPFLDCNGLSVRPWPSLKLYHIFSAQSIVPGRHLILLASLF